MALSLSAFPSYAEPPEGSDSTSPIGKWFQSLFVPNSDYGEGCCSNSDCRPVTARKINNGEDWEAFISVDKFGPTAPNEWQRVPKESIITDPEILKRKPIDGAVLCWYLSKVRCFVPTPDLT